MAGVKGRSGRPTNYQTIEFEKLIAKSFEIQMNYFTNPDVSEDKKVEYASRYLQKRVGEKIDIAVTHALSGDQLNQLADRIRSRRYDSRIIDAQP